ncbi:MAG TPA: hypothetical protein VJH22_05705 [Candidatus Nanoarchaeia archaeon]|nr:hypothetical protein [Candidatus Nanoarchaeia archaeon]
MQHLSTIQLDKEVIGLLKQAKEYPRQTYNELLNRMVNIFLQSKKQNQYDQFLHKIQQAKMKELWDNKQDEEWERA